MSNFPGAMGSLNDFGPREFNFAIYLIESSSQNKLRADMDVELIVKELYFHISRY
jgi:hypothetical protein